MKAPRPDTIQVGPRRYSVVVDRSLMDRESVVYGSQLAGNCDHEKQVITLDPDLGSDCAAETLLHEVIHAVNNLVGINVHLSRDDEERVTNALAPALLDTMRRNPALVKFLIAEG